ncbi:MULTISPECIES: PssD/Cps14F family polysaccharide biosynthesis glycosyltransferase [unclassified Dehalobacter]|uniref:PssD/Cps14F family polysaccharide biosynthesis glycosyltransferase n=1 Tax=unclassified Dehalobacter TaxID=2635733 RepID=UPI000552B47A|nr:MULTISPECIES: PssD/Cps14F family polysaccharide biosynthesis glycosyltransferase [unclassified Dehalobacter]RJE49077.1 beta-1,4-galactosyltransferase enhancer [Dehalobacter sp. MCB1]TCX52093.1 beta-1,4-galactosyltransferase enhancer [Dehalobacter sp. 14DCB1]TCX53157.1 beta-1,4-galactosyltransferase enhancer [Dehalobacter sp. 12DCB1]
MKDIRVKRPKLCLVSSSGGHWEQLKRLQPLLDKYDGFYVSEKTIFECDAKYLMYQTDLKDKFMIPKMIANSLMVLFIWIKEKPDFVITTGTIVAYPFYFLSRVSKKKFVFIETFARAKMPTQAGLKMHKHTDLFIVQWESQKQFYDNAVYGGCLY